MFINGRFLTRPATGVDRFATELLRGAPASLTQAFTLALPAGAAARALDLPAAIGVRHLGRRAGQAWEQWDLPRGIGDRPLVNLCNSAPLMQRNQLVVLHDAATLANPGNFSLAFRHWYRLMLTALWRKARAIATVSAFSADELRRLLGPRRGPLEVIPESGEHIRHVAADDRIIDRLGLSGQPFVLAVGSQSPNKNLAGVVAALGHLDDPRLRLVAAGGANSRVFNQASDDDARLIRTGYISDGELRALYEHAACFVFPSYYEGFGLPPLEAMNCGCPVIVSDRTSLPEVCGDAALYCDPDDPVGIARQIRRVLDEPRLREDLRAAGLQRAAGFTWAAAGQQFAGVLGQHLA